MSFSRYRLAAGVLGVGPALFLGAGLVAGCSGGSTAEGTPQAATTPAPATPQTTALTTGPAGGDSFDRYANPAPVAPAAKPAVDFDGDAFKAAVANQSVVGDRYSR